MHVHLRHEPMSEKFDPYRKWLGIPPQDQPAHHYRLLGISPFEDDPDVIDNAANRQMQHVRTFQHGRHSAASQKILNEISAAKLCLLDSLKKQDYDRELRQELRQRKLAAASPSESAPPADAAPVATPPASNPATVPVGVAVASSAPSIPSPISTGTRATSRKRTRRKSSPWPLVMGMIAVVLVIGGLVIAMNWKPAEKPLPPQKVTRQIPGPSVKPTPKPSPSVGPAMSTPNLNRSATPAVNSGAFPIDTNHAGSATSDPVIGTLLPPAAVATPTIDRFQQMVDAARLAMAERDYPRAEDFLRQANQEKKDGDADQGKIVAQLDGVRAYLSEFTSGVRAALSKRRETVEEHDALGHKLVFQPFQEGVCDYAFDGESRKFNLMDFRNSLRGLSTIEAASLADVGLRRDNESSLDANFRKLYIGMFLTVDHPDDEGRAERLRMATELWRAAAGDGAPNAFLRDELIRAGVDGLESTSSKTEGSKINATDETTSQVLEQIPPIEPARPAIVDGKIAVPTSDEIHAATEVIKSRYAELASSAADDASAAIELAKRLIPEGRSQTDPATKYAFFDLACQKFLAAGMISEANTTVDLMAEAFALNPFQEKHDRLAQLLVNQPSLASTIQANCEQIRKSAIAAENFSEAASLTALQSRAAQKVGDDAAKQAAMVEYAKLTAVAKSHDKLFESPDDASANLALGRFWCFQLGDWERGLPCLAKGNVEPERSLAADDLMGPTAPEAQQKLADRWMELAQRLRSEEQAQAILRARHWLVLARHELTGSEQGEVELRIAKIDEQLAR